MVIDRIFGPINHYRAGGVMQMQIKFLEMLMGWVAGLSGDGFKKFKEMLIALSEFIKLGMNISFTRMPNGETRARLMGPDGSGYIGTETTEKSQGWQESHFHTGAIEWYAVQSGKIAFAELHENGEILLTIIGAGGTVQSRPNMAHNVFMFAGAKIHTVKFGQTDLDRHPEFRNPEKGSDWWPHPQLDTITKSFPVDQIVALENERAECEGATGMDHIIVLDSEIGWVRPAYQ